MDLLFGRLITDSKDGLEFRLGENTRLATLASMEERHDILALWEIARQGDRSLDEALVIMIVANTYKIPVSKTMFY